jgi:hypothetical protein
MRFALLMLLALAAPSASAQQLYTLSLREFSMEYFKIANNRNSYVPYDDEVDDTGNESWDYGAAAKFDLDLIRYGDYAFHWSNRVHGESTNSQFRSMGWQFRWGLQLGRKVELFYDHHSQHALEQAPPPGSRSYPLENRYGAEVTFYRR